MLRDWFGWVTWRHKRGWGRAGTARHWAETAGSARPTLKDCAVSRGRPVQFHSTISQYSTCNPTATPAIDSRIQIVMDSASRGICRT